MISVPLSSGRIEHCVGSQRDSIRDLHTVPAFGKQTD